MAFGAGAAAAFVARSVAFAQEAGEAIAPAPGSGVNSYGLWDWLQIGIRLALVLGVIWGVFVVMRWYMRRVNGSAGTPGSRQLQIMETRSLGPNRALHLVRVGGRAVLIGVTTERINQLMEIDDPEEVERLAFQPPESETRSFRSIMGSLPASLRANGSAAPRGGRDVDAAPRNDAGGTKRGGRLSGTIGGILRRVAGIPPAGTPRRSRPQAPGAAGRGRRAAAEPMFDATPASALALRARSGYQGQSAMISDAPAPAPRPRRAPTMNRASREALNAAAEAAARPGPADRATSRATQIDEIQRAIATARRGLGLDAPTGRNGR